MCRLYYNRAFHILLADYPTTDFWVDGSDLIFENDWMWVRTDTLFTYTDWDVANNNPSNNNGYENCMEISLINDVCQLPLCNTFVIKRFVVNMSINSKH